MRKIGLLALSFALGMWCTSAVAQGHHGRPATTGVEHAETRANAHGDRGLENAESKQAEHKDADKDKDNSGKHKGKHKGKKHHQPA